VGDLDGVFKFKDTIDKEGYHTSVQKMTCKAHGFAIIIAIVNLWVDN
jgi:hypothetical protein